MAFSFIESINWNREEEIMELSTIRRTLELGGEILVLPLQKAGKGKDKEQLKEVIHSVVDIVVTQEKRLEKSKELTEELFLLQLGTKRLVVDFMEMVIKVRESTDITDARLQKLINALG
jgi:hypothetical protein